MSEAVAIQPPLSREEQAKADEAKFKELLDRAGSDPWKLGRQLFSENNRLRALLDLFEDYCEFRMGIKVAIQAKDIPTIRDCNEARKILGYNEIPVSTTQR